MSLTQELKHRDSRLNLFFAATLPDFRSVSKSYRAQLAGDGDVLRPNHPSPPWTTLGAAIDHRIRYAFTDSSTLPESVKRGMILTQRFHPNRDAAPIIRDVARDLYFALDDVVVKAKSADRSQPMPLPKDAEDRLDRICFALASFEDVYRSGPPRPGTLLGDAGPDFTLDAMLAAIPGYVVEDMAAQVERAEGALADLRAQTAPSAVVNGPTFAGSKDVGNADADVIIGDLLLDVKCIVSPSTKITRVEFYQLAGYALLDYDNEYGIQRLGLYLSRSGKLITWGLEEYLRLFGCTTPVDKVRRQLAEALGRE